MSKLNKLQQDWDDLAKIDPMWAICSDPTKHQNKWEAAEFFATGKQQIRRVLETIHDLDVVLNRGTALDFGCGIGRLTQALAEEFNSVYGVDISSIMIERAGQFNRFGERCRYILNPRENLQIFKDEFFDFIFTYIVLQHMPPDLMLGYLREFIRTLKTGGILMFQVPIQLFEKDTKTTFLKSLPIYHPHRVLNKLKGMSIGHSVTDRYYKLRKLGIPETWLYKVFGFRPDIQMHTLDEELIRKFMMDLGAEIVHVEKREDELSKMLWADFVVIKPT
jgi:ubiquinone/menaquinone biosynthesis C-methylase UbiE